MCFLIGSRLWAPFLLIGKGFYSGQFWLDFSDDQQLYTLSESLGDRLEASGQYGLEAGICYVVAGNVDKDRGIQNVYKNWNFDHFVYHWKKLLINIEKYGIYQGAAQGGAVYLQEMVEKILIMRKTPSAVVGPRGLAVLREYALLLSSQGPVIG